MSNKQSWTHNIAAAAPNFSRRQLNLNSFLSRFRDELRDNVVYWKTNGKINNDLQCDELYSSKVWKSSGRKHVVKPWRTSKKRIDSAETTLHNQQFSAEEGFGRVSWDLREVLASVLGLGENILPTPWGVRMLIFERIQTVGSFPRTERKFLVVQNCIYFESGVKCLNVAPYLDILGPDIWILGQRFEYMDCDCWVDWLRFVRKQYVPDMLPCDFQARMGPLGLWFEVTRRTKLMVVTNILINTENRKSKSDYFL